jgi:hypothetical protein
VGAHPGQLVLKLTVDATGRVVAVEVVSGDAALVTFLKGKLVGLTTAAKATAKPGAVGVGAMALHITLK